MKLFEAPVFIALLTQHLPQRGVHHIRRYGVWKQKHLDSHASHDTQEDCESERSVCSPERRATWARLIAKVYEVDPLICPCCGSPMKILAVITDREEVRKILGAPHQDRQATSEIISMISHLPLGHPDKHEL